MIDLFKIKLLFMIVVVYILLLNKGFSTTVINLNTDINERSADLIIDQFNKVPLNDDIVLNIDSNGGLGVSKNRIINIVNKNANRTTCVVTNLAASAAADIFMHCKNKQITNQGALMFHTGSYCFEDIETCMKDNDGEGKLFIKLTSSKDYKGSKVLTQEQKIELNYAYNNRIRYLINEFRFSNEELKELKKGNDVYIYGAVYNQRYGR